LRAVVVIPPVFDFYYTPHRSSGLGAEIVLELLHAQDCQADLFNFPLQSRRPAGQGLPSALNYLKPYIMENESGPLSFFTKYHRFGPSLSECADQVLQNNPDLICISCFAFCYAQAALELAETIRSLNTNAAIIVGGAGVSAYPKYFIQSPAIDFAMIGEAEVSMPLFFKTLKNPKKNFSLVPNLYYKSDGKIIAPAEIVHTKAQDILFVLKKTLETSDKIYFTTALSRGCPKACRFCSNFLSHGRAFRTISVEVVQKKLSEIDRRQIADHKKICINFEDDNLLCDPPYFLSVLNAFRSTFPNADFFAENGIDYMLIQPDLLNKLIQFGMKQFNISMATSHPLSLQREKREASLSRYEKIITILKKHKIPSVTYFICGLKLDTREGVVSTLAYLSRHADRVGISFFYPVPGIVDFQDRHMFDGIPACRCAGSSAFGWNQSLTTCEMVTAFRLSRFINLMNSDKKSTDDDRLIQKMIREQTLYTRIKKRKCHEIVLIKNMDEDMVKLFFQNVSLGGL
jgi:anaerobic magnesium-protoporphyrin IX monomethyl ester cyclase